MTRAASATASGPRHQSRPSQGPAHSDEYADQGSRHEPGDRSHPGRDRAGVGEAETVGPSGGYAAQTR